MSPRAARAAAAPEALAGTAGVFAALGDRTRLRLVARLCTGGPASIVELAAGQTVSRQAVSKHLQVLARAGLARGRRRVPTGRTCPNPLCRLSLRALTSTDSSAMYAIFRALGKQFKAETGKTV